MDRSERKKDFCDLGVEHRNQESGIRNQVSGFRKKSAQILLARAESKK